MPFAEAIDKLGSESPISAALSSSEWSDLPVELREHAFFSSNVESLRFLQRAQDSLGDYLAANVKTLDDGQTLLATGSRAAFVDQMQRLLATMGVDRTDGGLTDLTSERRLGLIFNVKTQQAADYGYWRQGMDPDVLNEFPAQRFIRVLDVKEPRELHTRFQDQVYLKTDPIWALEINRDFNVPWGPWGWGCGHDVEDVDRDEAESLRLLAPGEKLEPVRKYFNENLQASVAGIEPELLEKMKLVFGRQIVIENDTIKWKGNTDERNSDSPSGRIDHAAENNPRSIGPAAEAIFRDVRSRDTGKPLDASDALSGGAALSAVAAGRKPLYHEEWGQELGADLARRLWGLNLPGVQITLADDGHLFAYRPEIIQAIIDADPAAYPGPTLFAKIHEATLAGDNGELLGYGARSMLDANIVLVEIMDGETTVFGFYSRAAGADQIAAQRTLDFSQAYGRAFSYEITPR